jgi:hypothetical protein
MSEIENKIKEAHKVADKELRRLYFEQKMFGIKRKYYYIVAVGLLFAGFVL